MIRFLTWLRKEPLVFYSFVLAAALFFMLQLAIANQTRSDDNFMMFPLFLAVGAVALGAIVAMVLRIKNADALRAMKAAELEDDEAEQD